MVDLFRWHGSEEVEHRTVAHDVAVYFHDSYVDRIRAMATAVVMTFVFFQRAAWYLVKTDPNTDIGCVSVASTGETVRVGADETLLSALGRAGVHASYCQQGFCGTCHTRALDGTVDHRDALLTDPERDNGLMLICISRAADGSHLTLDL